MTSPHSTAPMKGVGHTPGPWPVERSGDGKRYIVGKGLVEGPHGYEVAEVYSDDCDPDEAHANARLIAAAPDLLEACEAALTTHSLSESEPGLPSISEVGAMLSAAIAKARGDALDGGVK